MLSLQTIHPDTLELLKTLMNLPIKNKIKNEVKYYFKCHS